ncbi:MAG: Tex-like N-terminal domain-containing protein, partial [Bacillota bacterium]
MDLIVQLTKELKLPQHSVASAVDLLDAGNTIPFIARYRKEMTGELDENQLRSIEERLSYLRSLEKRKEEVLKSIAEQGKLSPELEAKIQAATILQEVEDLYLPYRPKRRTRASMAKEKGLEPLAEALLAQPLTAKQLTQCAEAFINADLGVSSVEEALAGAQDIIAERVAEDADHRRYVRNVTYQKGVVRTKAVDEAKKSDFEMYYEYQEPLHRLPPHRV